MSYDTAVSLMNAAIFASIYLKGGKVEARKTARKLQEDHWDKLAQKVLQHCGKGG